jgi:hypothetical protein
VSNIPGGALASAIGSKDLGVIPEIVLDCEPGPG